MEILGKVLSEKTEAIYKDITGGLIYPIKIVKLDPENEEDCSRPVAMDTGKKEFIVKVDNTLADNLFENELIRNIGFLRADVIFFFYRIKIRSHRSVC